jgi:Zn-dependent oligopeptidase
MHPREGKDKWFSSAPVVPGIRGRQMPEGALICNFPGGVANDPGLMEYSDVVVFFHEFGHLMHHILGSQGQWANAGGFSVEGDFVEAPSQMLEEMFRDRGILSAFAKDYKTGAVIPAARALTDAVAGFRDSCCIRRTRYNCTIALLRMWTSTHFGGRTSSGSRGLRLWTETEAMRASRI